MSDSDDKPSQEQKEILSKLDNLTVKLEDLEKKITKLEKDSVVSLDDQLFIGLVLSIGLLLLTFPELSDLSQFFTLSLGIFPELALILSESLKNVLIICLLSSSFFRYIGSIKNNGFCKYLSIELVIFCLIFCLWSIFDKFFWHFLESDGFTIYIIIPQILVMLISIGFGFVEKRIINFYVKMGHMQFYPPFTHFAFFLLGFVMFSEGLFFLLPEDLIFTILYNPVLHILTVLVRGIIPIYLSALFAKKYLLGIIRKLFH